jgi:hypothetical protein
MKTKSLLLILTLLSSTSLFSQIPSYVPTNGLVGYWPFNGNANDESGNGNHGTVNGATLTTDRFGSANAAYLSDHTTTNSITGSCAGFPSGNSQRTLSIWYYSTLLGSSNCWGAFGYGGDNCGQSFNLNFENIDVGSGKYEIQGHCQAFRQVLDYPSPSNGVWHNIIITYDGSILRFYNDGGLVYTSNPTSLNTVVNGKIFNLIGEVNESGTAPYFTSIWKSFPGKIDDIGIWNRALTQQEITALYQSNNCSVPAYVPTNGLVGYWPFCGNANDVSGNGNNGTVNGATLTADRNGNANEAYSFDGGLDYISILNSNSLTIQSDISIAFWFNANSSLLGYLIDRDICNTADDWSLYWQNNNVVFRSVSSFAYSDPILINSWNYIVLTRTGGKYLLFLNSILVDSLNISASPFSNTSLPIFIGDQVCNSSTSPNFDGLIDDIGIWNRALSALEIQQLYNSIPCTKPAIVTLGTSATTVRCPNDSVSIFVVEPTGPGLFYEWYRNGTALPTATASSITVSDIAKYKVAVRTGPGVDCQRISGIVQTTTATPPVITITAPNGNAYCPGDSVLLTATGATAGYSYQWKRFGVAIPGATSANFNATQTGNYRCEVTNAGGCISLSNIIGVTNGTSCRVMQEQPSDVSVYPNPAKNSFTVSFNDIGNEIPVSIELRNLQGQIIENRMLNGITDVQFNTEKLSPSMYLVRIMLESGDVVEKNVMVE